ncbi:MAG: rRNA maturation RNase YbeY [Bacteroidales bacterium]|nr:rRNA maturation RNase YbeY [Bacteroidales bacterium]
MINIQTAPKFQTKIDLTLIMDRIHLTLIYLSISNEDSDFSLVIDDNDYIQSLNSRFRQTFSPTDVLSFPAHEVDPESGRIYLGDIIIAFPFVEDQAKLKGFDIQDEITMLIIHGLLHLIGYDHDNTEEKKKMWDKKKDILSKLNISPNIVP